AARALELPAHLVDAVPPRRAGRPRGVDAAVGGERRGGRPGGVADPDPRRAAVERHVDETEVGADERTGRRRAGLLQPLVRADGDDAAEVRDPGVGREPPAVDVEHGPTVADARELRDADVAEPRRPALDHLLA